MRHIDADKFIERIKASPAFQNVGTDGYFLQCVVLDLLRDFPTADVDQRARLLLNLWGFITSVLQKFHTTFVPFLRMIGILRTNLEKVRPML